MCSARLLLIITIIIGLGQSSLLAATKNNSGKKKARAVESAATEPAKETTKKDKKASAAKSSSAKADTTTLNATQRANLIKTIRYAASSVRRQAMAATRRLDKSEQTRLVPILVDIIKKDRDNAVRATAADMLGHYKVQGPFLTKNLKTEENDDVILKSIYALKRMKYKQAAPAFMVQLNKADFKKNDNLTISVIDALAQFEFKGAEDLAMEKVKDSATDKDIQHRLYLYLGAIKSEKARKHLMGIVADRDAQTSTRSYAANAIGKIGNTADAPAIQKELDYIADLDPGAAKRYAALRRHLIQAAIRLGKKKELLPLIIAGVRDDDPNMRISSIRYLGEIREQSVTELLTYVEKYDQSPRVKKEAGKALESIRGGKK